MPCYKPLPAARVKLCDGSDKVVIYSRTQSPPAHDENFQVPCGQCIGCRLERSRQWAIRCIHEAQVQEEHGYPSCFITLTYDDDHYPTDGSLVKHHFQDFMKRLRKRYAHTKIRYYQCGEYGDQLQRPHYHACIFGIDFEDKVLWKNDHNPLYTSATLSQVWGKGFVTVGDLTFESAAYTARYILKKQLGKDSFSHYTRLDENGLTHQVEPEYTTMSLKPGIGSGFYTLYKDDMFPENEVVINGRFSSTPRYYRNIFQIDDPETYEQMLEHTKEQMRRHEYDNTPARLEAREQVKQAQMQFLKREL